MVYQHFDPINITSDSDVVYTSWACGEMFEFTTVKSEVRLIWTYMDITGIDLFDQIVGMACARVGLRSTWLSLALQLS